MGGATLHTKLRKQDQERKGHLMRFGKASDPELDIVYQLGLFMDKAGTRPRMHCTAGALRGKRCLICPPLFPKLSKGTGDSWVVHADPQPSPALVSSMVVAALQMIGVDTTSFSGVCCASASAAASPLPPRPVSRSTSCGCSPATPRTGPPAVTSGSPP